MKLSFNWLVVFIEKGDEETAATYVRGASLADALKMVQGWSNAHNRTVIAIVNAAQEQEWFNPESDDT